MYQPHTRQRGWCWFKRIHCVQSSLFRGGVRTALLGSEDQLYWVWKNTNKVFWKGLHSEKQIEIFYLYAHPYAFGDTTYFVDMQPTFLGRNFRFFNRQYGSYQHSSHKYSHFNLSILLHMRFLPFTLCALLLFWTGNELLFIATVFIAYDIYCVILCYANIQQSLGAQMQTRWPTLHSFL